MTLRRRTIIAGVAALIGAVALWSRPMLQRPLPQRPPLAAPDGPLATYHLGHSLVGRDMPAMLAQFAGHLHASQLGWGASLMNHATGEIAGFATENDHPAHEPAEAALASGRFGVVVLTEMVELADALRYHDSARWLAHWAKAAQRGNPAVRVYLYETWHRQDDPQGWLSRLDTDLASMWTDRLLTPAMRQSGLPIYLIPAGQVMAATARAAAAGQVPGLPDHRPLFSDEIHLTDLGHYLVALTHYATIYQRDPTGLPHAVLRADGTPVSLSPDTARALQQLVWSTVPRYAATGMARGKI